MHKQKRRVKLGNKQFNENSPSMNDRETSNYVEKCKHININNKWQTISATLH